MIVDKNTKRVVSENIDFKRIMSEGGVLWEMNTVPGPTKLIGGNLQAGFYGEVPTSEFITGDELARRIGLTAGTSQFSNEPWLKFSYLGKTEFIAKKGFRRSISWDNINAVNAVYGNRIIEIDGLKYRIRLIKGRNEGQQNVISDEKDEDLRDSEWNRLFLPIYYKAPSSWQYPNKVNSPTDNWNVGYKDSDLRIGGIGADNLCQEFSWDDYYVIVRGNTFIENNTSYAHDTVSEWKCWRPVLELIN